MLKIPGPGDTPPPLMAPLRRAVPGDSAPEGMVKKRRRGRKHNSEDQSWESQPKPRRSSRHEKRQMILFLIGGALLLALTLGGGAVLMKVKQRNSTPAQGDSAATSAETTAPAPVASAPEKSDPQLLAEAEPVVRKFMEASTVDQLVPLVRHPVIAEARMRDFYPDGKVIAPGLAKFDATNGVSRLGRVMSVRVLTAKFETREMAFFDTPEGVKIDWESWVGWSEMPWDKFRAAKPETPRVFRVILSPVAYYNFGFKDDSKWQSYRLISPDGDHSIYGYVEKRSELGEKIRPDPDVKKISMTLSLKFPPDAATDNQVEIVGFVADGWVEGMESK